MKKRTAVAAIAAIALTMPVGAGDSGDEALSSEEAEWVRGD